MSVRLVKPWTWFWGLLAGFVQGGATAVTSGPTAALFAPQEFSIKTPHGFRNLLLFMAIVFVQSGLGGAMFYLAKTPVPQIVENGNGHTQHITKENIMKTLVIFAIIGITTGAVSGCAARVIKPYIKETI